MIEFVFVIAHIIVLPAWGHELEPVQRDAAIVTTANAERGYESERDCTVVLAHVECLYAAKNEPASGWACLKVPAKSVKTITPAGLTRKPAKNT